MLPSLPPSVKSEPWLWLKIPTGDDPVHFPHGTDAPPAGTDIIEVERMSRALAKYYLSDGCGLHRFRMEEPHANPHDHLWSFETEIIAGGYVDKVFHLLA